MILICRYFHKQKKVDCDDIILNPALLSQLMLYGLLHALTPFPINISPTDFHPMCLT